MNTALLDQIVEAVLYEGYILYPYRPSSRKNQRERFTFGRVYPESYSRAQAGAEPCRIHTECLVQGESPRVTVSVRFLQPVAREIGKLATPLDAWNGMEPPFEFVPELRTSNELYQSWHEAIERRIQIPTLELASLQTQAYRAPFTFADARVLEPIWDGGRTVGVLVRRQAQLQGTVEVMAEPLTSNLFKLRVSVLNHSELSAPELGDAEAVLLRTLASTHTVLHSEQGAFVSLMDPGPEFKSAAQGCRNIGTWPVLVGDEAKAERDTMLSSPIILYEYPKIAPASAGPLFDGTEIDEILTLRIQTMTEQEKMEMRQVDEHARRLLQRTEQLPGDGLLKLHGTMRPLQPDSATEFDDFFGANVKLNSVRLGQCELKPGDRVRLQPKARADIMDLALSGQVAVIEAIEQDLEKRIHLAVVLENDPGKDLGLLRQPGHRFFYGLEEVEPLLDEATTNKT